MATLADAHMVDSDITEGTSGKYLSGTAASWTSTSPNSQSRTLAYPQDRSHLNAETVQILDDGVVVADQTVSGGVVTGISGTYHIGLAYTSTVKPTKLDIEGMGLILTKRLTKAIVSFYNTLEGQVGTASTKMETVSFDSSLFSGEKEVPLQAGYERTGDIIITQSEPVPMTVRGLILDLGAHLK